MKKGFLVACGLVWLMPIVAWAQQFGAGDSGGRKYIEGIITFINGPIMQLLFAVVMIVFLITVFNYFVLAKNVEEKKAEGKRYILMSLIGVVIMVSFWGIVQLLVNIGGLGGEENVQVPAVKVETRYGG